MNAIGDRRHLRPGIRGLILAAMQRDLATLFKLRLGFFVVLSAVLGWFMAVETMDIRAFLMLTLGGYALTGASNGLNQIMERRVDGLMARTQDRPLPTGRMSVNQALAWSLVAAAVGLGCLFSLNPLSGWLGVAAIVSYAFVYTPLKGKTSLSVFVGAFPGALPPMIGYVAATGDFGIEPGTLFAVQFMWQFLTFGPSRGLPTKITRRRATRCCPSMLAEPPVPPNSSSCTPCFASQQHVALGAEPTDGGRCCFHGGCGGGLGFLVVCVPLAARIDPRRRAAVDVCQLCVFALGTNRLRP